MSDQFTAPTPDEAVEATEAAPSFYEMEGAGLFTPVNTMLPSMVAKMTAFIAALQEAQEGQGDGNSSYMSMVYLALDFIEENCILDIDAYKDLYARRGFEHIVQLTMGYLGELGAVAR